MVHSHLESIKWFICLAIATSVASGVVRSEMQAGLAARVSLGQQKVCFPATWGVKRVVGEGEIESPLSLLTESHSLVLDSGFSQLQRALWG